MLTGTLPYTTVARGIYALLLKCFSWYEIYFILWPVNYEDQHTIMCTQRSRMHFTCICILSVKEVPFARHILVVHGLKRKHFMKYLYCMELLLKIPRKEYKFKIKVYVLVICKRGSFPDLQRLASCTSGKS